MLVFLIPVFLSFYLGYSIELINFSTGISDKVISYSDEMSSVTQCVLRGSLLDECSEKLENINFESDIESFSNLNDEIINKTSKMLESVNLSIN
jgi:hypothetical protein